MLQSNIGCAAPSGALGHLGHREAVQSNHADTNEARSTLPQQVAATSAISHRERIKNIDGCGRRCVIGLRSALRCFQALAHQRHFAFFSTFDDADFPSAKPRVSQVSGGRSSVCRVTLAPGGDCWDASLEVSAAPGRRASSEACAGLEPAGRTRRKFPMTTPPTSSIGIRGSGTHPGWPCGRGWAARPHRPAAQKACRRGKREGSCRAETSRWPAARRRTDSLARRGKKSVTGSRCASGGNSSLGGGRVPTTKWTHRCLVLRREPHRRYRASRRHFLSWRRRRCASACGW